MKSNHQTSPARSHLSPRQRAGVRGPVFLLSAFYFLLSALSSSATWVFYSADSFIGFPGYSVPEALTNQVTIQPYPPGNMVTLLGTNFVSGSSVTFNTDTNGNALLYLLPNSYLLTISGVDQSWLIGVTNSANTTNNPVPMADLVLPGTIGIFTFTNNYNFMFVVDPADTTPGGFGQKIIAGQNVTITTNNVGGNETLTINVGTSLAISYTNVISLTNLPPNIAFTTSNNAFVGSNFEANLQTTNLQIGSLSIGYGMNNAYLTGFGDNAANGKYYGLTSTVLTNSALNGDWVNFAGGQYYVNNANGQARYSSPWLVTNGPWTVINGASPGGSSAPLPTLQGAFIVGGAVVITNLTTPNLTAAGTLTGNVVGNASTATAAGLATNASTAMTAQTATNDNIGRALASLASTNSPTILGATLAGGVGTGMTLNNPVINGGNLAISPYYLRLSSQDFYAGNYSNFLSEVSLDGTNWFFETVPVLPLSVAGVVGTNSVMDDPCWTYNSGEWMLCWNGANSTNGNFNGGGIGLATSPDGFAWNFVGWLMPTNNLVSPAAPCAANWGPHFVTDSIGNLHIVFWCPTNNFSPNGNAQTNGDFILDLPSGQLTGTNYIDCRYIALPDPDASGTRTFWADPSIYYIAGTYYLLNDSYLYSSPYIDQGYTMLSDAFSIGDTSHPEGEQLYKTPGGGPWVIASTQVRSGAAWISYNLTNWTAASNWNNGTFISGGTQGTICYVDAPFASIKNVGVVHGSFYGLFNGDFWGNGFHMTNLPAFGIAGNGPSAGQFLGYDGISSLQWQSSGSGLTGLNASQLTGGTVPASVLPGSVVSTNNRFVWSFFPTTKTAYTNSLPPGTVPFSYTFVMITVTNSPATGYTTTSGPLDVATVLDAPTAEGNNGPAGASLYFDRVTNMVVTFYANPQGYPAAYSMEPPGGGNIVAAVLTNWNFQVRVQQ